MKVASRHEVRRRGCILCCALHRVGTTSTQEQRAINACSGVVEHEALEEVARAV